MDDRRDIPTPEPLYAGMRMSADEYERLEDDGFHYEVIDGVVVMAPSPNSEHQAVLCEIIKQLGVFLDDHPIGRVLCEMDVRFGPLHVYQPDALFISKSRMTRRTPRVHVVPEMVLEILSPGTKRRDLGTKKTDYERFGVDEYWIIDPAAKRPFSCLRRKADRLVEVAVPARSFRSQAVPGFVLDLVSLRRVLLDE